ncbi:hypothetical protein TcWFU_004717 [Taenia crassiceps]|uniref:Uncharacterized protein n=1 Tax=Taenia crassiceps TaxID=6207 RepID=A0ABR4QAB4_9CEST
MVKAYSESALSWQEMGVNPAPNEGMALAAANFSVSKLINARVNDSSGNTAIKLCQTVISSVQRCIALRLVKQTHNRSAGVGRTRGKRADGKWREFDV